MAVTEVTHGSVKYIQATDTAATSGSTQTGSKLNWNGQVVHLVTQPSSSKVPSANWDLVILDKNSVDILAGGGANRSSGSTQHVQPTSLGYVVDSSLTVKVSSKSSTGHVTVTAYIR